jgi:hypothetical protein
MRRLWAAFALLVGCAGPVEAIKVVSPEDAARANGTKLHAVAILRGDQRAPLPDGVTVQSAKDGAEVRVPREGTFEYALDPGETVERDAQNRVVAVKSGQGKAAHETRFIAGTADQQGDVVRGELEDHVERVPLFPGDRIELRGTFGVGETLPLDGKVETTRAWSALGFGAALLGGGYLPSMIVAATSSVAANHWLYAPVVGPWVAYAARDSCATGPVDPTSCFADAATRIALIFDGIVQSAGLILVLVGLPTTSVITWGKDGKTALRVDPMLGHPGLSLSGSF